MKNVGSASYSMATTVAVTVPASTVVAGNFIVVRVTTTDTQTNVPAVADTDAVNVYTVRLNRAIIHTTGGDHLTIYECAVTDTMESGDVITVTLSNSTTGTLVVDEWSGVGTYDTIGTHFQSNSSATPSANVTPAGVGLVVGVIGLSVARTITVADSDSDGGGTWSTLTTVALTGQTHAVGKITTSAVTQTFNVTLSSATAVGESVLAWNETVAVNRVPYFRPYPQLLAH